MKIAETSIAEYLNNVAAKRSTPGGGAVAAIAAAEGLALMGMVTSFTHKPNALPDDLPDRIDQSCDTLLQLADADAVAFDAVMAALRGKGDLAAASITAARVPLKVINIILDSLDDLEQLAQDGNPNLITDTGIAASLLASALDASELNILINIRELEEAHSAEFTVQLARLPAAKLRLSTVHQQVRNSLS